MPIGKRLDDLINLRKENVNSIATQIGVSPQTIYSIIKRDNMKVDFDVLMKLSKRLDVPVDYFYEPTFNFDANKSSLYVENSPVPANAETGELNKQEQTLIHNYRALNDEGQEKLFDYSEDLVSSGRYTKNNQPEIPQEA